MTSPVKKRWVSHNPIDPCRADVLQCLPAMYNEAWLIVDTETNGLMTPIHAVEIAAQRMRGWQRDGDPFRVLLNHDVPIDPAAQAVHGYSRAYLRQHGTPPLEAHAAFHAYAGDRPMVAFNLSFDWDRVLLPQYTRLGVPVSGRRGFCALTLARRVIRDVENYKLDTLKLRFGLNLAARSHEGRHDVETVTLLFEQVLAPKIYQSGLFGFEAVADFARRTPVAVCLELIDGASDPCWYFLDAESNSHGPFSAGAVRQVLAGKVAYVWKEGMSDWVLSSELSEFAPKEEATKRRPYKERVKTALSPAEPARRAPDPIPARRGVEVMTSMVVDQILPEPTPISVFRRKQDAQPVPAEADSSRWTGDLIELCQGIITGQTLTVRDVHRLQTWLAGCPCTHVFPINVVSAVVKKIVKGNVMTDYQLLDLREALESILPVHH